jgi:ADP-ribosylglycohydrolase
MATLDALARAHASLEGLALGDAFGDRLFFDNYTFQHDAAEEPLTDRRLPAGRWTYTDDTQMALSVVATLASHGRIDQDALARSFGERFERGRGYGPAMYELQPRLRGGVPWQTASRALFGGQGSFGNGGAMRVAPLGAYFADDLSLVVEQATLATEVTHSHPEAIAGSIAVAVAAALSWQLRGETTLTGAAFLDLVLPWVPASIVRQRILQVREFDRGAPVWDVVRAVGNGSAITAQDTVPFCLWCAAHQLDDYLAAIWRTADGLGDIDTNCAIVGGIVAARVGRAGLPANWLAQREPLPAWALPTTNK